jgi:hypothetical protein
VKVVFLDIDGVLNSKEYVLKLEARHKALGHDREACTCFKLYQQIDPAAVARVNRLVAATGAKIVISSSWRKLFDPPELHRMLSEHGLIADIIGETPDAYDESLRPDLKLEYGLEGSRIFRGHEIDYWLRYTGKDVDRFVIFDDDSDMAMHKNRLVQTDSQDGLLDEHVELAIRVLEWDGKTQPSPIEACDADVDP